MDPETIESASQSELRPPLQPGMDRSLSSDESGSDSSANTEHLEKSPAKPAVASSAHSPPAQQGFIARLRNRLPGGKGQGEEDDDRQSTNKTSTGKKEDAKERASISASTATKSDEGKDEKPGQAESESEPNDEEDEDGDDERGSQKPCNCCKSCTAEDVVDNVLSIICCPCYSINAIVTCLCWKCPRIITEKARHGTQSAKAAVAARRRKRQAQPEQESTKAAEEPEGTSSVHDSTSTKSKDTTTKDNPNEDTGTESKAQIPSSGDEKQSGDKAETGESKEQPGQFFPNPETDDDRR